MLLSSNRNLGRWRRVATFASAVAGLGLVMAWPLQRGESVPAVQAAAPAERCTAGDDVSNFICRNTWVAGLKRNYR
jgi:hypothetical protein